MTITNLEFVFGAILLAIGVIGGGFEVRELKVPRVSAAGRLVAGMVGLAFIAFAVFRPPPELNIRSAPSTQPSGTAEPLNKPRMGQKLWGKDLFGADYSCFDLPEDNPQACQDACQGDPNCASWTYIRPNTIRGPRPVCCLKSTVPSVVDNAACVSGIKER